MRSALAFREFPEQRALLGVERSATGRRWDLRLRDERQAYAMAQAHGIAELLARILAGRGVALDDVPKMLSPQLRTALPDPSSFADMDKAAGRLARAIMDGEKVVIFGDYDVDGATSSALLKRFGDAVGGRFSMYIPDRIKEGYGPNLPALMRLADEGARVVVTVDCGSLSFAPLAAAKARGIDVIVVDHHQLDPVLPEAYAIVNPNRADDQSGQGLLAAVGVAFLLAVGVNRALREAAWYAQGRPEPPLIGLLDLVALGTVADVVPLRGLNRVLVARGLQVMADRGNVGLNALGEVARLTGRPSPYHLGFLLGPRVNAGGRVGESELGARLLCTDDLLEARQIAARLDRYNQERQAIEQMVLDQALARVDRGEGRLSAHGPIVLASEGWHPGVIGIVAGRLKERFSCPAIVIGLNGQVGKGSGRSITGIDLGLAIRAAAENGLLLAGGGHAMAAGLTISAAKQEAFAAFLDHQLSARLSALSGPCALLLDGVIEAPEGLEAALSVCEQAQPYGSGFAEPVFVVAGVVSKAAINRGNGHMVVTGQFGSNSIQGIAFRAQNQPLGQFLAQARGQRIHIAARLKRRGGAQPELHIEDAASAP